MPVETGPRLGSRLGKVLLATDLSPASVGATDQALELARLLGAPLLVVSVIDPRQLRLPGGRFGQRVDQVRAQREIGAQALVERGRRVGVDVTFLIWEGDPGEAIVDAATAEHADLIVVGSHGRSGVGRFLVGSVSDHVVRHAPCPVMVVRASEDGAPARIGTTAEGAPAPIGTTAEGAPPATSH
jgi:nucleotide-binding universal stress UspA family protein